MRIREIALDMGWLLVLVLLIPVAIPLFVLAFIFLLGQRLYAGVRNRRQFSSASESATDVSGRRLRPWARPSAARGTPAIAASHHSVGVP